MTDRVVLAGIDVQALIGVFEHERHAARPLRVDLELACDLAAAESSDDLEDTIDYAALTDRVRARCAASSYRLVEALAGDIARICLADPRVTAVKVTVHKPGAVQGVSDVAVVLDRARLSGR